MSPWRPTLGRPKSAHRNQDVRLLMPESDEKRELGGLAQSIDALFSQRPRGAAVSEPEAEAPIAEDVGEAPADVEIAATDDLFDEPELVEPAAVAEDDAVGFDPDPFDALDEVEVPASSDPEVPADEVEPESVEPVVAEFVDPLESDVLDEVDAEAAELSEADPIAIEMESAEVSDVEPADPVDAEPTAAAPEVPGSALAEAVDAFLAGHPGAAKDVESIAAKLRERLALDPLADAAERLVMGAEDDEDDPAMQMAGRIVNPAVASRIVQRMALEENEPHRAHYLTFTKRLGTVMANAFKGVLTGATDVRTRRACYEGLISLGDEGRPVIEAMVEDDNSFLVRNGVTILGEIGGEGAVELVTSALANTDFRVRRDAVSALAKLGGEDSSQLIMASLEDPDPSVRAAAAEAAGQLGIERALKPILALLEDDSLPDDEKVPIQVQALRALGHLGDPGAVQVIEKRATGSLFSKPPTEVRVAAYQALHDIGTPHAREVIEKAKSDKDPVVRTTVRGFGSA